LCDRRCPEKLGRNGSGERRQRSWKSRTCSDAKRRHDGGQALGGDSFKVLGGHRDKKSVIVASRIQINGAAPIGVDWQLNPTNDGYKVTDMIVNGISMASAQHSDLVSVIQRNSGQLSALLIALREKNASNGIIQ
jgi:hypothetical protein